MADEPPTPAPAPEPAPAPTPAPAPSPAPSPEPAPKTEPAADWRTGVTDEKLREHAGRFTSLDDLVKANLDSRSKLSKAIIPPSKDAKPEEVAAYRKAIGVPEAPDKYKFPAIPEGVDAEPVTAARAEWAKTFHDNNVPAHVAEALIAKVAAEAAEVQAAQVAADKAYADKTAADLKQEWGADYEANQTYANRAAAELLGKDLEEAKRIEMKDGRFLLDHPHMLRVFAKYGREMAEGGLGGVVTAADRDTAQTELKALRSQIETAQSEGNSKQANALYQKEQAILNKLGNKAA